MSQQNQFNFDPSSYPDQESLDAAIAQSAVEKAIAERTLIDANNAYAKARSTGLDPVSGRQINASELALLQANAVNARRTFEQYKGFEKAGQSARSVLKPRAAVKSEADLETAKQLARAEVKSGGLGNVPGAKKTPESNIVKSARAYSDMAPEDKGGFLNYLTGRFVPETFAGVIGQTINPIAALTTTPSGMAARNLAGEIDRGGAVLPEDAPVTSSQPFAGGAGQMIGSKSQIESSPEATIDPYVEVQPSTLTPQQRSDRAVRALNTDVSGSESQATKKLNKMGGDFQKIGYGQKVGQLATLGGMAYALWPSKTPTLESKIKLGDKLEGDRYKALLEKLEPLRASELSDSVEYKALIESRDQIKKDVMKVLRDRFRVNVEGMSEDDLYKQASAQGLADRRNADWVKANESSIQDWASKPRNHELRSKLNTALDEYTKGDKDASVVYLGKDRYGVKSKKLEGGTGGWTIASVKDGKLSIAQDDSPYDQKPSEGMTLGDWTKLKGGQAAYDRYQRGKSKSTPVEEDF